MKTHKVRVLLVDDHAVVRAGYRLLLQTAYGTQLKAKLGVATVAELTRLAIRHGVTAA
jgi:hypothetical protein